MPAFVISWYLYLTHVSVRSSMPRFGSITPTQAIAKIAANDSSEVHLKFENNASFQMKTHEYW